MSYVGDNQTLLRLGSITALGSQLVDLGLSYVSAFLSFLHLMLHLPVPGEVVKHHRTCEHELISVIRDGEDVGWSLNSLLASVSSHNDCIVYWEPLVGVHSDAEQP